MSKVIPETVKLKIIGIISVIIPDAKIYLFGSRARGTHGEWSDIDLALDNGNPISLSTVGEINDVLQALSIPYKIDVVDFYSVNDIMKAAIMKDKIEWKV